MAEKRLYKVEKDRKLFGVCGGVAEYLGMDPTIIRVLWAILTLFYGIGLLVYIICAFVFPDKSTIISESEDETKEE